MSGERSVDLGPLCPACGEPWLRRFELLSGCPDCGAHSTIARMSSTHDVQCHNCGASMLQVI